MPLDRPWVFRQGCIADIYRYFFAPLMQFKPEQFSDEQWLAYLFDSDNRVITRHVCMRQFEMPGLLYKTLPNLKIQGVGYRKVKAGQELYVRMDKRNPGFIDVEYPGTGIYGDQVFQLTAEEWGSVARYLKESKVDVKFTTQSGRQPD